MKVLEILEVLKWTDVPKVLKVMEILKWMEVLKVLEVAEVLKVLKISKSYITKICEIAEIPPIRKLFTQFVANSFSILSIWFSQYFLVSALILKVRNKFARPSQFLGEIGILLATRATVGSGRGGHDQRCK
jgi:hypothetical protein